MRESSSARMSSLREISLIKSNAWTTIKVDHVTDCMDLWELVCGVKGLSADKNQRLVITALREDRQHGNIRQFQHWPTSIMLADGLTKSGSCFLQLLRYATTRRIAAELKDDKCVRVRGPWKRQEAEHNSDAADV